MHHRLAMVEAARPLRESTTYKYYSEQGGYWKAGVKVKTRPENFNKGKKESGARRVVHGIHFDVL